MLLPCTGCRPGYAGEIARPAGDGKGLNDHAKPMCSAERTRTDLAGLTAVVNPAVHASFTLPGWNGRWRGLDPEDDVANARAGAIRSAHQAKSARRAARTACANLAHSIAGGCTGECVNGMLPRKLFEEQMPSVG